MDPFEQAFKNFHPATTGHERCSQYAVMILLQEIAGQTHLVLELRCKTMKSQPGEVSFPGGKKEPQDPNFAFTALRETCEELGVDAQDIQIIQELNTFVAPFNILIRPFLGRLRPGVTFCPSSGEVDHIFTVPLDFFQNHPPEVFQTKVKIEAPADFPYKRLGKTPEYRFKEGVYEVYLYEYGSYVIWGMTAKMIFDFLYEYKKALGAQGLRSSPS